MFNLEFLATIRADELATLKRALPPGARVLELGGGTGQQASMLARDGYDVVSVDVAQSEYRAHRVFPVIEYDGVHLPFADQSFDVVLSSNVLEHVTDLAALHAEIHRVLRPGGRGVHAMPTHAWRFWTSTAHYVDLVQRLVMALPALLPRSLRPRRLLLGPLRGLANLARMTINGALPARHGERGNVLSEIGYFHPAWWRRQFLAFGFEIEDEYPMGLFYTGYMVLGPRLGLPARCRLSRYLGSACQLFIVRQAGSVQHREGAR